ncbi:OB-fold nucleic acid binding domain-containing protein [Rhizobium sp. TRM95796]|uniref:OB-fold nucleic acid binding domain-containing protein n=1 Tax=Rhizobium sp. TRM95796 TaxID=2979862 RepID=UPI003994A77F
MAGSERRAGSAKGVIFMTIEDETGVANAIVWPKVFEAYRPIVMGARLAGVRGRVQKADGVIHVVAESVENLTDHLAKLSDDRRLIESLANAVGAEFSLMWLDFIVQLLCSRHNLSKRLQHYGHTYI